MDQITGTSELCHILEKLVALHRNLVDLLHEEFGHMGEVDVKGLAEAAHAKEVILSEIWNLEQVRIKIVEKLAPHFNISVDKATLSSLAEVMQPVDGDKLRAMRTALGLLVTRARDLNARNMVFAQESLSRIDNMKRNALGLTNTAHKENYSNSGARQPLPDQGGRLLSTEA